LFDRLHHVRHCVDRGELGYGETVLYKCAFFDQTVLRNSKDMTARSHVPGTFCRGDSVGVHVLKFVGDDIAAFNQLPHRIGVRIRRNYAIVCDLSGWRLWVRIKHHHLVSHAPCVESEHSSELASTDYAERTSGKKRSSASHFCSSFAD
jgi:hypothetical protein